MRTKIDMKWYQLTEEKQKHCACVCVHVSVWGVGACMRECVCVCECVCVHMLQQIMGLWVCTCVYMLYVSKFNNDEGEQREETHADILNIDD